MDEDYPALSEAQRVRVQALKAARSVLVARNFGGSGQADATEVVSLAMFIETGRDPYQGSDS